MKEVTPGEKQSQLQQHRDIALATIDYLMSMHAGSFVLDNNDHLRDHFTQQKLQVDKYFRQGKLDKLQQQLSSLTKGIHNSADLAFASYVKEKTGYDIDIFEGLRKRVDAIIEQNEIRTQKELTDVGTMLQFYQQSAAEDKEVEKIKSLLTDYSKRINETSRKRKSKYSEITSSVEKDNLEEVTVSFSTGPKPKHYKEQWITSHGGNHKLRVAQWSDGQQASTYVAVHFANGSSGAVYSTRGICPGVSASWKDNSTIVIETKTEYEATAIHKQVRSFDDVISIEYIEY